MSRRIKAICFFRLRLIINEFFKFCLVDGYVRCKINTVLKITTIIDKHKKNDGGQQH